MTDDSAWPPPRVGWYATIIITVAYTFSFVDRQVLNLLVEPIQADLGLSDTRISFLQGLAFVIPYVIMSVPLGRMADAFNRVGVLIGGVLVWSLATLACGLSRTYGQLAAARMFVGTGEASVAPAAWSMLADYFPKHKLVRPVSVYLMGPYLGAGLALIGGAEVIDWARGVGQISLPVVGELSSWQFTFMAVAAPGIVIIGLLALLKDPIRRGAPEASAAPPWHEVLAFMRSESRIYLAVLLGVPFLVVILYGLQAWVPTILVRVYGWDLADAGRVYGTIALLAGSAGVLSGPVLGQWLERRGYADYPLRLGVLASVALFASMISLPWQSGAVGALICIGAASFFVTLPLALMTFVMQTVSPNTMRGVVAGIYVVTVNVMGLGLGPTLVALTTDYILADPKSVHVSLAITCTVVAPVSGALLMSGMRGFARWHRKHA